MKCIHGVSLREFCTQCPSSRSAERTAARIEAEPVGVVTNIGVISFLPDTKIPIGAKLYLGPLDRTPDARSTTDERVWNDAIETSARWFRDNYQDFTTISNVVDNMRLLKIAASSVAQADARSTSDLEDQMHAHTKAALGDARVKLTGSDDIGDLFEDSSTSDAAVGLPQYPDVLWLRRVVCLAGIWPMHDVDGVPDAFIESAKRYHLAMLAAIEIAPDRATRSTDSSAEAAERERVALGHFTDYFVRNYPGPDTIITRPTWHAPKVFRAALYALKAAKLTIAPHTVDKTRDAGYDADDAADFKRRGDRDDAAIGDM